MSSTNSSNIFSTQFYFSLIEVKEEIEEPEEGSYTISDNWQPRVVIKKMPLAVGKKKKENYWQAEVKILDRSRGSHYYLREKKRICIDIK